MKLSFKQLENIAVNRPNKTLIDLGIKKNKKLRMHMYGDRLQEHIEIIEGFEKPTLRSLRAKYAVSNEDLFTRLGRPEDKVYSAKGGSVYYNLPAESEREARLLYGSVINGYSVPGWVENFWRPHFKDDPCGVVMMEIVPADQITELRLSGGSLCYPTYRSITCIYDYQPKGIMLDYIAFEVDKPEKIQNRLDPEAKVLRIVDDAFDYYVLVQDNKAQILWDHTIVNYFGYVPAIINSDIVDPVNKDSFNSLYKSVTELADQFLLKGSIKITHDFMHGFPKYSEFADDCPTCAGTGWLSEEKCPECKGSGLSTMSKVSQVKHLSWPQTKDQPIIYPDQVGGYVEPSKNYYEISVSDLGMLENCMNLTLWGTQSKARTQGTSQNAKGDAVTATQVMDEAKPEIDRLRPISAMVEKVSKFILDAIIRINITPTYQGASVNAGRRYMLEGPDALWTKYADARAKGVAISALDDLLLQYFEAEYASDPIKLAVMTKLMKVEPFVHYKTTEVYNMSPAEEDYKAKLYYGEWLSEQASGYIVASEAKELRASLYLYSAAKKLPGKTTVAA